MVIFHSYVCLPEGIPSSECRVNCHQVWALHGALAVPGGGDMWGGTEEPQVWFIANLKCDMPGLPNQLDEYCCLICLYMVNSFSLLVFLTTITWKITRQAATYLAPKRAVGSLDGYFSTVSVTICNYIYYIIANCDIYYISLISKIVINNHL